MACHASQKQKKNRISNKKRKEYVKIYGIMKEIWIESWL